MKLGFLTDIHEDYPSLCKAIDQLESRGCAEIICLGDVVGFSVPRYQFFRERDARACIQLIREKCTITIAGNHDFHAIRKTPSADCGFTYPPDWYQLRFSERKEKANGKVWLYEMMELSPLLEQADEEWLDTLPEVVVKGVENEQLLLTHYLAPNLTGHLSCFADQPEDYSEHFQLMKAQGCNISFTGHHHVNGVGLLTPSEHQQMPFGRYQLPESPVIVNLPCVVRDRQPAGVATYDTETRALEVWPI